MAISRRNFLGGSLAASAFAFNNNGLLAEPNFGAVDAVILGGKFYTMDPSHTGRWLD